MSKLLNKRFYNTAINKSFLHKELSIIKSTSLRPKPDENKPLLFGHERTDYMLECDWNVKTGWGKPVISPYHNLSLPPSVTSLHYALQCFEGLKAYSGTDGKDQHYLFRPELNASRFKRSAQRIALPTFDEKEFVKCLAELVYLEKDWIPKKKGYSLYVRPTMISTSPILGVSAPGDAKMFMILSPVGPYFQRGFVPVKLLASEKYVRAFPGGTGEYKVGGNYSGTIVPQREAAAQGFDQILWVYGEEDIVTEAGTMNFLMHWKNQQGEEELITAPLSDGTILPGVTRDTCLALAKQWGIKVAEKRFTMKDLIEASQQGRILEAFGAGTAAIISPVSTISFKGKDIQIPTNPTGLGSRFRDSILAIQHGEVKSPWAINLEDFVHQIRK